MLDISQFFERLFEPFRQLRNSIFRIKQAPMTVKSQLNRAKSQVGNIQGDFKSYGQDLKDAKNLPGQMKNKVGGVHVVGSGVDKPQASAGGASPGAAGGGAFPQQPPTKPKKFMGLFSSNKCPQCGQKLHASWQECPYCGWGKGTPVGGGAPQSPSSSGGGKQRTVALELGGAIPGADAGVIGWFIPLEGKKTGELFQLKGRVTVGASTDNDISLDGYASISSHHCEFIGSAAGFKLNDLGSTNGTFVNDKRVATHDLVDNDNVKLGKINFKFKSLV